MVEIVFSDGACHLKSGFVFCVENTYWRSSILCLELESFFHVAWRNHVNHCRCFTHGGKRLLSLGRCHQRGESV